MKTIRSSARIQLDKLVSFTQSKPGMASVTVAGCDRPPGAGWATRIYGPRKGSRRPMPVSIVWR